MINLAFFAIIILIAANFFFGARELLGFFRSSRPQVIAINLAVVLLISLVFLWAGRDIALRGGSDNEHDFEFMSTSIGQYFDPQQEGGLYAIFNLKREISSGVMKLLVDHITFFSLSGFLFFQKIFLLLAALLFYGSMRKLDMHWLPSLSAVLLLIFNYNTIIDNYAFFSSNYVLFYLASGLFAWAHWFRSRNDLLYYFIWYAVALALIVTSRIEFLPFLLVGSIAGLINNFQAIKTLWKNNRYFQVISVAAVFIFFLAIPWGFARYDHASILFLQQYDARSLWAVPENFCTQLAVNNLNNIFGLSCGSLHWILMIFIDLLAGAVIYRKFKEKRYNSRQDVLFALFLAVWIGISSFIFHYFPEYPLQLSRHQIYFFLPFAFFFALVIDQILRITGSRKVWFLIILLGLIAFNAYYIYRSQLTARSLNAELRDNDREWQFLYDMRKKWPPGYVVTPASNNKNDHWEIIRLYFPRISQEEADKNADQSRILVFRSYFSQVYNPQNTKSSISMDKMDTAVGFEYGRPFQVEEYDFRPSALNWLKDDDIDLEKIKIGFYYRQK